MTPLEELNQASIEAQAARVAVANAGAAKAAAIINQNNVLAETASMNNIAAEGVTDAQTALDAAHVVLTAKVADAHAKLDAFVNSQPEGVPSP